jgi:formylglycine-generating enzyme required for sulfatase activity
MAGTDDQDGKREIKIYQRVYRLSTLGGGKLDHLQSAIRQGSETLQRGYVVKKVPKQIMVEEKGFFSKKLVPKMVEETVKQTLEFEERFQALNNLVQNYDAVIATLKEHQDEYQDFFENLADEIKGIVAQKCQEIADVEQERLAVERLAHDENDDDLLQITLGQKSELLETAKAIGYAAILMLKKLDLMSASLDKIANDQQTQREVLESMVKKLTGQKRAYEVQLKIKKLQADAAELTKIALNFESYMEKFMGSFQTLLGNVASVDQELSGAMKEIQQIAELAMGQQAASITMDDESSQKVLNFLMASNLKKERLLDALEQAREANTEVDFDYRLQNDASVTSLADCLENIQAYVQFELKPVLAAKEERQRQELLLKQEQERIERETAELRRQQEIARQQEQERKAAELRQQQAQKMQQRLAELKLELVDIPAGTFMMGDNSSDYDDEKPAHSVTLKAFKMSKYPITQAQYEAVMGHNPSHFKGNLNHPVESVSWHDAQAFCRKLSEITGMKVSLPTESQWEYACRAGSTGKYCFGDNVDQLGKYAWYNKNSDSKTHPVGEKLANAWGLHDMHGNVWEWCEDVWHGNYNGAPTDGSAWLSGGETNSKILRGGSWNLDVQSCRSANRFRDNLDDRLIIIGFRFVSFSDSSPL